MQGAIQVICFICHRYHGFTTKLCHRSDGTTVNAIPILVITLVSVIKLAPLPRTTVKDVLLFLVHHFGIHSHCLFVIHRCH